MPKDSVGQYLAKHADFDSAALALEIEPVSNVICIPLHDEDEGFLATLESAARLDGAENTLLILLVNGAEDNAADTHARNAVFIRWLRTLLGARDAPASVTDWRGLTVLLIDRAQPGRRLPAGQGVGLARKIAGDVALALHRRGTVRSPWMACTDADVRLPHDYLRRLPSPSSPYSAALFPFEHTLEGSSAQSIAMQQYESYLHYYVLGLSHAGSPYAYHSVGSSFAVHMEKYAAVRGFPRKLAAEDFYLLNKLIKQAPLIRLTGAPIRIRGRESNRVPFGTGKAVLDIQQTKEPYRVYNPLAFDALAVWVRAQHRFCAQPKGFDWAAELQHPDLPSKLLYTCLDRQGALVAAEKSAAQVSDMERLQHRMFEWNDAFRTLRLIHMLRDAGLGTLPILEAFAMAPFTPRSQQPIDLDTATRMLGCAANPKNAPVVTPQHAVL